MKEGSGDGVHHICVKGAGTATATTAAANGVGYQLMSTMVGKAHFDHCYRVYIQTVHFNW